MVEIHRESSISGYCVELQGPAEQKRPGWYLAADTLWRYPVWQGALTKGGVLCCFSGHRRLLGKPQPAQWKERGNQRGQRVLNLLENSRDKILSAMTGWNIWVWKLVCPSSPQQKSQFSILTGYSSTSVVLKHSHLSLWQDRTGIQEEEGTQTLATWQ